MIAPRQQNFSTQCMEYFREITSSTIGHFGSRGYLKGIRPLFDNIRMLGNVLTVNVHTPDGSILRDALLLSEPGDVLVIDCQGEEECACWGELRTLAALVKGLSGVVVNGAVTDVAALRAHRMPVFSLGISAYTTRSIGQHGEINQPLKIAGVQVNPGDLAIGDDDGVFILDKQYADALLPELLAKEALDRERRAAFVQRLKL